MKEPGLLLRRRTSTAIALLFAWASAASCGGKVLPDDGTGGGAGHSGGTGGTGGVNGTGGTLLGGTGGGTGGTLLGGTGGGTGGIGGSVDGGAGGGVMLGCEAASYSDYGCGTCMEGNCAMQCAACLSDADCQGYIQCTQYCNPNDFTCLSSCASGHANGAAEAKDWLGIAVAPWSSSLGCLDIWCAAPCGQGTGGSGGSVSSDCTQELYSDPTCGACMEAKCAAECEACFANSDCMGYLQCAMNCVDQACMDACAQQYPDGVAPTMDWIGASGCLDTQCGTECGM